MISWPGSGPLSKNPGAAAALLHQLEQRRLAAMWANDAGALADILAKTMIYIHESGRLFHREEYLAAIADGVLVYHRDVTLSEEEVTIADPALVATGVMRGHGQLGDREQQFNLRYSAVWLNTEGDWRLALIQKTPIVRRKPPIAVSRDRSRRPAARPQPGDH
jgi:hypothetical protein